jgi:hypothetical protein
VVPTLSAEWMAASSKKETNEVLLCLTDYSQLQSSQGSICRVSVAAVHAVQQLNRAPCDSSAAAAVVVEEQAYRLSSTLDAVYKCSQVHKLKTLKGLLQSCCNVGCLL